MVEPKTSDIFGFVPGLEDAHPFEEDVGGVQGPESDVPFPTGHDLVSVQRVELRCYHCVNRALKILNH